MGKILVIKGADFSAVAVGTVTPITGRVAINVVASPSGGGTTTGSGSYQAGSQITISATAATGYKFSKWSDGVTTPSRTITVGETSATYTAEFVDGKVYFSELTPYSSIYGDVSTKAWKQGGQLCHIYPTLIKAGSVITFGGVQTSGAYSTRHGISDAAVPVVGGTLSFAQEKALTSFTATADGYLYICTPTTSGYTPAWDDIKDGWFTVQEP